MTDLNRLKRRLRSILQRINAVNLFGVGIGLERRADDESHVDSAPDRLLRLVWQYPLEGEAQASWAVKESSVLRGNLGTARERPGLGVSIIAADLALRAFEGEASERLDGCVAWALGRRQKDEPYYILSEQLNPVSSAIELKPDFRHTLAFAVLLQLTGRCPEYLAEYIAGAVNGQQPDGGWAPGSGMTVSEVFTVLYATELMHGASCAESCSDEFRRRARDARDRALEWLARHRNQDQLWESRVLKEYRWDGVLGTAWVLHRLSEIAGSSASWRAVVEASLKAMVERALDPATWAGIARDQRNRVEARIAAGAARAARAPLSDQSCRLARTYVGGWRANAERWVTALPNEELDLATALFALDGMLSLTELKAMGTKIATAAS